MYWVLVLFGAVLTFPLAVFGAFVRLKGAGLSCPDWPLCYGKIIPPPGLEIALETGHRLIATLLGICIILLVFLTYRISKYRRYRMLGWSALIIVIIQGLLGGLTVILDLWPPTVILHLLGANALFGILIFLCYQSHRDHVEGYPPQRPLRFNQHNKKIVWMMIIFIIVLISGGVNSSTYSGYSCDGFPGCHQRDILETVFNDNDGAEMEGGIISKELEAEFLPVYQNEWYHMIHRIIAFLGALLMIWFSVLHLIRKKNLLNILCGGSVICLLIIEFGVGIANAFWGIPIPISSLHTALAVSIIGIMSFWLSYELLLVE
ncbi:MAG: COX15/CtaA family protein [Deltaproteobacteria bacterium]|nr:COX15/CtaA family protein [Deltaproteobacteria bacterium]